MNWRSKMLPWYVMFATGLLLFILAIRADAGVNVAVTPQSQTVTSGTQVGVSVEVTSSDLEFNTYGLDIAWGSQLSLVGVSEGSYFPEVCGSTFFSWNPQTQHVGHGLLCFQTFVTGPGKLVGFVFATTGSGQAAVTLGNVYFYRAGYPVTVSSVANATVTVNAGGGGGHGGELEKPASTWGSIRGMWR